MATGLIRRVVGLKSPGPPQTEGQWKVYLNGQQVVDDSGNPIVYPNDAQPGTKGFDYGFSNNTQEGR